MLSSAYTSGWLIAKVGTRPVLGLMAFFPLLMCLTAGLIREQRQQDSVPSTPETPSPGIGECTHRLGHMCAHTVLVSGTLKPVGLPHCALQHCVWCRIQQAGHAHGQGSLAITRQRHLYVGTLDHHVLLADGAAEMHEDSSDGLHQEGQQGLLEAEAYADSAGLKATQSGGTTCFPYLVLQV